VGIGAHLRLADMTDVPTTVIKHPNSAYLIVGFVALCATAIVRSPVQALVYLVPLAAAIYVARTATIVDNVGITARAVIGSERVDWPDLVGLRLTKSSAVYAVDRDGSQLRLPCVRSTKLDPLIKASKGRIPDPGASPAASGPTSAPSDERSSAPPPEEPAQ
jgi:PH (Pleckstrin Homology) domain-containing protein